MPIVQHIYCCAIISKKMCDALTSFVSSISAAKGRGCPAAWPYQSDRHSHDGFYLTDQYLAGLKH